MIPGVIEGSNMTLLGNGDDVTDLKCLRTDDGFASAWFPTPAEMKSLNEGNPVYLVVYGDSHPPVMLGVKA